MATTLRGFVNDLSQVVQQTNTRLALKLAKGQIKDMSEYNRAVGRMEGTEQAVAIAREMLGQMESAEDHDGLPEMSGANKK